MRKLKEKDYRFQKYRQGMKYPDRTDVDEDGEQVLYTELDGLNDAGLVIDDKTVVIDIDDTLGNPYKTKNMIRKIIEIFAIETQIVWTDRGAHLYFDKPRGYSHKGKFICKLGFEIEAKQMTEKKNSVTIKKSGIERKIENKGILADLPAIFTPVAKSNAKAKNYLMVGVGIGGRNDQLFKFRANLNGQPDADKIAHFANDFLFEEPLEAGEVESTILSASQASGGTEDSAEEYLIADKVLDELRPVKHNGKLYYLTSTNPYKWTSNDEAFEKLVFEDFCEGKTAKFHSGVIANVKKRTVIKPSGTVFPVAFKNGLLEDGDFLWGVTNVFTPHYIDVAYDPKAEPVPAVDEYLNGLTDNDPEYRSVIEEMIGLTLVTDPELIAEIAKFFVMYGGGGNGKGTFLKVIKGILGEENASSLKPQQMENEAYSNNMIGKLANLGDDIDSSPINDKQMTLIKNISTADLFALRHLHKDAVNAVLTCTLIFTSNHRIKSWEKGESYKRRVVWMPMLIKPKKTPNFIKTLLTPEAKAYWIKLMIDGYFRLYENRDISQSETLIKFNEEYHNENNNTIEYVEDAGKEYFIGHTAGDTYKAYQVWCENNATKALQPSTLKEQIEKQFGLVTVKRRIRGIQSRFYTDPEDPKGEGLSYEEWADRHQDLVGEARVTD